MKGFDFVETVSGGADIKFADDNRVIEVGQAMYAQAASSLLEAVGDDITITEASMWTAMGFTPR